MNIKKRVLDVLKQTFEPFVNHKDVSHILQLMPTNATYYFTQADIPRALPAENVKELAKEYNLQGNVFNTVDQAYEAAQSERGVDDTIFIGGSTFVVADLLTYLDIHKEG